MYCILGGGSKTSKNPGRLFTANTVHLNQLAQPPRRAGEWKGRQVEVAFVLWAFPLFLLSSYGLILFYLMYCVAKSYLKICS